MPEVLNRLQLALADRYRVNRELGQGGMAVVYLAEDLRHGRKVAIKVLHPELSAVIGVPDDEFGQRLRAYVVPASEAKLDDAELRAHVKANLARYKVPRDILVVEAIPRNAAGKIVNVYDASLAPETLVASPDPGPVLVPV